MKRADRRLPRGFTFIEILIVMGIIAVLVGLGVGIYKIAIEKTPKVKTRALLMKMRANIDSFRGRMKAYPPTDLNRLPAVTGLASLKIGRPNPDNVSNPGIEALYQALRMPGLGHDPDLQKGELCNTDEDALDRPLAADGDPTLFEIKDAYDNPLVYFAEADYKAAEKDPPVYLLDKHGEKVSVYPKPYRSPSGGFAQPGSYQIFSMGPDGEPNTADDVLGWEEH